MLPRCLIFIALVASVSVLATPKDGKKKQPNILILIADDLGSQDLGCFGNDTMRTPRIDTLAKEGVILTQHVTADSVCTPNRAAFYTGRYPKRMGMVATGVLSVNLFLAGVGGLPHNETTFAHLAQRGGYRTAIIGKWHLGLNCKSYGDWCHHPMKMGFDYYYGLPLTNLHDFGDDGLAVFWRNRPEVAWGLSNGAILGIVMTVLLIYWRFHPVTIFVFFFLFCVVPGSVYLLFANLRLLNSILMRGFDVVEQPIILSELTPRLVKEGTKFIEDSVKEDKPFLVVMSWIHPHTALITMPQFRNRSVHGRYGDAVEELDWSVGKMLDLLDKHGLRDDTFIYFGSDNAAHVEETGIDGDRQGGFNGKLRGGKFHSGLEGAVRIPGIVRYPGVVPAGGQAVPQATLNMDVWATVANLVNQQHPEPERFRVDAKDMMPLMVKPGPNNPQQHEFIFHYCGQSVHSVRYAPPNSKSVYKMLLYLPNYIEGTEECYFLCRCGSAHRQNPPLLFDLSEDETERHPIDPTTPRYKEVRAICEKAIVDHDKQMDHNIPSQFSWEKQLWRPWTQPCCGGYPFPFCGCRDKQDIREVAKDLL